MQMSLMVIFGYLYKHRNFQMMRTTKKIRKMENTAWN